MHAPSQPPGPTQRRYCFVFVCQAGELEIKALLLAASLKRYLRCDYELVAAVPTPATVWGELSAETRDLLRTLGVRIEPIVNPIDTDYKIGNKLACLGIATDADKQVFLDSDILCLREFHDPACLRVAFAAKPADVRTFAAGAEAWRPLYSAAQAALPELRLPTTVSGEFGLAYFNSGVIFVDTAAGVGQAWIDCARRIQDEPSMRTQRHWLDQVSLAIAAHKLGLEYTSLDERYNFPAHLKPLPGALPFFCHYHWPRIVRREPALLELVRDLAHEHPAIATRMADDKDWSTLLHSTPVRSDRNWRRLFQRQTPASSAIAIAGIPGSGAGDLLRLLGEFDRCIAIDEPVELQAPGEHRLPWEIAAFVRNQQARNPHCVIAVKPSPGFLLRLDVLPRVLPQARVVACVDNPFATIARWKRHMPMQELDAAIAATDKGAADWLTQGEVDLLRDIVALNDPAEKRATWWWWLAQRLLNHAHGVIVVRHDNLVADQSKVLREILRGMRPGRRRDAMLKTSLQTPTLSSELLDRHDRQAIRAICMQAAADLGVSERD